MATKRNRRKNNSKTTFKSLVSNDQVLLQELLSARKFSVELIKSVLNSGYFATKATSIAASNSIHVGDGFYGSKTFYGLIPLDIFCDYLKRPLDRYAFPKVTKRYKVHSLKEAIYQLQNDINVPFFLAGEMAFRGQTKRYYIKRSIPNPMARDLYGTEELILASYWRQFLRSINNRPVSIKSQTVDFSSPTRY